MHTEQVFGVQLVLCLAAWVGLARTVGVPKLDRLSTSDALIALTWPHVFRHISLIVLVREVVDPQIPLPFTRVVAGGELTTTVLAAITLLLLHRRLPGARACAAATAVVGLVSLTAGFVQLLRWNVLTYQLGTAWLLPVIAAPALAVLHALTLRTLGNAST